jgi:ABC-type branched-subunit amino acid transport system substrate-binding protein
MKTVLILALLFSFQQSAADLPIKVGIIVPSAGAVAEAGAASRAALKAYFDEINSKGGINGRKLEISVALTESDPAATSLNIKRLITDDQVIAFVGGIIAGNEREVASLVQTEAVPLIGPATLNPPADQPLNRYGFYLLSGVKDQARALVNFAAAKPELKKSPATIIYFDDQLNTASAEAAEDQAKKLGWNGVTKSLQRGTESRAVEIVNDLKQRGAQAVFVFATPATLKALIEQSIQAGVAPTFFATGFNTTPDTYTSLTPAFKDKFFLSFPSVPGDITAIDEYRALQAKYQLPAKHIASQLLTLAAAKTFVEALKRAMLNSKPAADIKLETAELKTIRQKLTETLEGLKDFETGFSPRVTFAPDRHIGAPGSYMVTFDPTTQKLAASGWISSSKP